MLVSTDVSREYTPEKKTCKVFTRGKHCCLKTGPTTLHLTQISILFDVIYLSKFYVQRYIIWEKYLQYILHKLLLTTSTFANEGCDN